MNRSSVPAWVKRLLACLGGGFVLAMMVGSQEGTTTADFGTSFFHAMGLHSGHSLAWHFPFRLLLFLGFGVLLFLLITGWGYLRPYLRRPGILPLLLGFLGAIVAQTVMNWFDPLSKGGAGTRFNVVRSAVNGVSELSGLTNDFFQWLGWTLMAATLVSGLAAIVFRQLRKLGFLTAALGVAGAWVAYKAHDNLVGAQGSLPGHDHSLGVYADVLSFLLMGFAGLVIALSNKEVAEPRAFLARINDFRPGLPLVVIGAVFGLFGYLNDCWFGPLTRGSDFAATYTLFHGHGISALGDAYLNWLGWAVFIVSALLALTASTFCSKALAWLSVAAGLAGIVVTFFTLHSMAFDGFQQSPNDGQRWANIGVGGFSVLIAFGLFASASAQVLFNRTQKAIAVKDWARELPVTAMIGKARESAQTKTLVLVGLSFALFYPPMLTATWQNTIVTQIGVYILLAIGLNVVVGWAGLLDLGYIAFYAIGSYTTAYFTGSLPKKPPSFLHFSPLLSIPFAILACLIAGVLLGAPTLRLRGDYLAIVTLAFGEIITVVATNNPWGITGGPIGPTVPPPRIHLLGLDVHFGGDNLPYWYLLLVLIVVVLVLFYRLEGSRLGRAWAAIREDEVAAQASGVNTRNVKLLAFAIGASTSGLAGVFFATQVGYFDPTLFTLQFSILIVAYVVFGGMGSLQGAMAGAAVLTWLPQFLKAQVPQDDRPMWVGGAILAMMIFRPAGLLPAKRRRAELEGLDAPASAETFAVPASEGL